MSATSLISRLQMLGEDSRPKSKAGRSSRSKNRTAQVHRRRYFTASIIRKRSRIDGRNMFTASPLWRAARRGGGLRGHAVVSIDASGIRKRIVTPSARLRAGHIVLAGKIISVAAAAVMGKPCCRSGASPAVTAPLGERLPRRSPSRDR